MWVLVPAATAGAADADSGKSTFVLLHAKVSIYYFCILRFVSTHHQQTTIECQARFDFELILHFLHALIPLPLHVPMCRERRRQGKTIKGTYIPYLNCGHCSHAPLLVLFTEAQEQ